MDKNQLDAYVGKKWKSFNEFALNTSAILEITFEKEQQNKRKAEQWRNGTCTCRKFLKNYICEHVVGMCLRLHYLEMPNNLRYLSQKKKKRPHS